MDEGLLFIHNQACDESTVSIQRTAMPFRCHNVWTYRLRGRGRGLQKIENKLWFSVKQSQTKASEIKSRKLKLKGELDSYREYAFHIMRGQRQ
jgi:hypothetical protein